MTEIVRTNGYEFQPSTMMISTFTKFVIVFAFFAQLALAFRMVLFSNPYAAIRETVIVVFM